MNKHHPLLGITILILLGAIIRLGGIGREPLRGDEAFAVRYWADDPVVTLDLQTGLAWREPHPLGTFLGFWGWRSLVGDGEIPMRALPALINLLGIPAIYALTLRLQRWEDGFSSDNMTYRKQTPFTSDNPASRNQSQAIGAVRPSGSSKHPYHAPKLSYRTAFAAALLYTLSPTLIWHSQDVRNYAPWVGLSLISLWLGVRLSSGQVRKADRWLYPIAAAAALYTFFLEAFLIVVQGWLALLSQRRALRHWSGGLLITLVVCTPLFYQAYRLAGSGYRGALNGTDLRALPAFFDSLTWGDSLPGAPPPTLLLLVGSLVIIMSRAPRLGLWLAGALVIPSFLLILAATRLDVFGARYLIALTPLIFITFVLALREVSVPIFYVMVGAIVILLGISLRGYFSPDYHKAPDWYGLRDYLRSHVNAEDAVIMASPDAATGVLDPALGYYYRFEVPLLPLPYPGIDTGAKVAETVANSRWVWFIVSGPNADEVDAALWEVGELVSDEGAGRSFMVRAYRKR